MARVTFGRRRSVTIPVGQEIWSKSLASLYCNALPRKPSQAATSGSHPMDLTMNSSRVWQTIAAGARPCADALISAFRA
jgi:hypothetical protein